MRVFFLIYSDFSTFIVLEVVNNGKVTMNTKFSLLTTKNQANFK